MMSKWQIIVLLQTLHKCYSSRLPTGANSRLIVSVIQLQLSEIHETFFSLVHFLSTTWLLALKVNVVWLEFGAGQEVINIMS